MHNGAHIQGQLTQMLYTVENGFKTPRKPRLMTIAAAVLGCALLSAPSSAQSAGSTPTQAGQATQPATPQEDPFRFRMPTVNVTAQKEPEDIQKIPVSVTAVSKDLIEGADIQIVSQAAIFAPNTFFTEWSARKLSNGSAERAFPSSAEEGWLRGQEKAAKQPWPAQTGWCWSSISGPTPPRPLPQRMLRDILLGSRPPLLC